MTEKPKGTLNFGLRGQKKIESKITGFFFHFCVNGDQKLNHLFLSYWSNQKVEQFSSHTRVTSTLFSATTHFPSFHFQGAFRLSVLTREFTTKSQSELNLKKTTLPKARENVSGKSQFIVLNLIGRESGASFLVQQSKIQ